VGTVGERDGKSRSEQRGHGSRSAKEGLRVRKEEPRRCRNEGKVHIEGSSGSIELSRTSRGNGVIPKCRVRGKWRSRRIDDLDEGEETPDGDRTPPHLSNNHRV